MVTLVIKLSTVCSWNYHLCHLRKKIEKMKEDCEKEGAWCHASIFQLQNKEAFRELMLELECCYKMACGKLQELCDCKQIEDVVHVQFYVATYEQVQNDQRALKSRLELMPHDEYRDEFELEKYLLEGLE